MKQNNLKKQQETLRNKFLKKGVKMISPETIFFCCANKYPSFVFLDFKDEQVKLKSPIPERP